MGGEITWECQGNGSYVFDLVVYRDCNGFDVSTGNETIDVWNHPNINSITVSFLSRQDISPTCTQVGGGPNPFLCGIGTSGGNGSGAVEKVIYRSAPVFLLGNPPAQGWIFTYKSFSRSGNLTNIQSPTTVGITIVAKMFTTSAGGVCNDSSPQFLEVPFVVSCAGQPFTYNPNAFDPDLDSMSFTFGTPFDQIITTFNPPADPALVNFEPGFSFTDPTPDASFNASNIPATLNAQNGELSFTSFTSGNFAVKEIVQSFRNGVLISEVQREIQVIVENCGMVNTPPIVVPPFSGGTSFETTVYAGDLVTFSMSASDVGTLQDASPQSVTLTASGAQFGTNLTNPAAGCAIAPCAILNAPIPIIGSPNVQANFTWQTACAHLQTPQGLVQSEVPYTFVFRIQDDVCQIPAVRYATVTVHVKNKGIVPAVPIDCIQVQANGDVQLTYEKATNVDNGFVKYSINSLPNVHLADEPNINTTTYNHVGANANAGVVSYYVGVQSGCNGGTIAYSDTISSIFLTLNNPGDGTAVLQWTAPDTYRHTNWSGYYYIEREYPTGTWTVIDSVAYGSTFFKDTIDICSAFLNYRIELKTTTCSFLSNIEGDIFEDKIPPRIPVIQSVTIDTITGNVTITWDVNSSPDTYGYIIYNQDQNGFFVNLDTTWGRGTITYTYSPSVTSPLQYAIAAFDSCYTPQFPPTYQTSAKSKVHTSMFLKGSLDICAQQVNLNWTSYVGWNAIDKYEIYGYSDGKPYSVLGSTSNNSITLDVDAKKTYCFVIKATSSDGKFSFSNKIFIYIASPIPPSLNYLATASVENDIIEIRHHTNILAGHGGLILERLNEETNEFEEIERRDVSLPIELFEDSSVDPNEKSYTYRTTVLDSCGNPSIHSNIGKTIFLQTQADNTLLTVSLQWTAYKDWLGPVLNYEIYREVDGIMGYNPIAIVPPGRRAYVDHLEDLLYTTGKFCYVVKAIEGTDTLGIQENSKSNRSCATLEPIIYVPNAFTVGGVNPIFLPIVSLTDFTKYEFTVFDRWGQTVFRTNDLHQGWDGTIAGKIAEESTYVYVIRLHDGNGDEVTKRGHVTLLNATK